MSTSYTYKHSGYDDTFLEDNTELSAYFLGLFMADGWLDAKNNVFISLTDKQLIDDLATATKYTNKITSVMRKTTFDNKSYQMSKPTYRLSYAKAIKIKMIELGFTNKKTGKEFIPSCISSDTFHHFLRGLTDGDGSIFLSKGKLRYTLISASKSFLETILSYLIEHNIIITRSKIHQGVGSRANSYTIQLGHENTIKLCEYMYNNATIKLNRKYEKYIQNKDVQMNYQVKYTPEEIELAKNGIVPPNRSYSSFVTLRYNLRKSGIIGPANNKRMILTHNGEAKSIQEWSNITGIPKYTIYNRIKYQQWSVEKALTTPHIT